jgi:hypothetical protein
LLFGGGGATPFTSAFAGNADGSSNATMDAEEEITVVVNNRRRLVTDDERMSTVAENPLSAFSWSFCGLEVPSNEEANIVADS